MQSSKRKLDVSVTDEQWFKQYKSRKLREVLLLISKYIGTDEFKKMKFLLKDKVDRMTLEQCTTPLDLFDHLMDIGFVSFDDTTQLQEILNNVECHVESRELKVYANRHLLISDPWYWKVRQILEYQYKRLPKDDEECALSVAHSVSMFTDGGSDSEEDNNLNNYITKLSDFPIRIDGPSTSIRSNLAKRVARKWAQGGLDSFTLAFYIESNRVKHSDIVDIIYDQRLAQGVACSRAELAVYIEKNQKSVLFIIDGCDGDQINPTDNTAYGIVKKIKETSYCSQCPVIFTAGY